MDNSIDILLNDMDRQFDQDPQSVEQITAILKQLQQKVNILQDDEYIKYGYYQYQIADKCLSRNSNLNEQQRERYSRQKKDHKNNYDEYIVQQEQQDDQHDENPVQSAEQELTQEQIQNIQFQLRICEKQKNEGAGIISTINQLASGGIKLIKASPKLIKAVVRVASPIRAITQISEKASFFTTVSTAAQACVSKWNVFAVAGIAALELSCILINHLKEKGKCVTKDQKQELCQRALQEIKAVGARTVSSFAINSASFVIGATLGSLFTPVGAIIGGALGAILGAFGGYYVDTRIIDPFFLEKTDFLKNAEYEIGLESFQRENGRAYTKDEFEQKLKRCLINEHPDKYQSEPLKKNARAKILKILLAKEIILQEKGWNQ